MSELHTAASFWMGVNNCKTDGQRYATNWRIENSISTEASMKFPIITLTKDQLGCWIPSRLEGKSPNSHSK